MKRISLYVALLLLASTLMAGCQNGNNRTSAMLDEVDVTVAYAQGFRLAQGDGYRRIDIINPWDTTTLLHTYILVNHDDTLPAQLPEGEIVRTPLRNSLVFSSVHCSLLDELECLDAVGGICDSRYIYNAVLRQRLTDGTLTDAGNSTAPNIEAIINLNPDAILLSPFENVRHERLVNTRIPIVECADYMEATPLGRAEWIRLFGWLYGCSDRADSLFNTIKESYIATTQRLAQAMHKPKVITERRTGQVWYIPGGNSYVATLLHDAGASYPWSDNDKTGSIPLSFENVFEKGQDADYWIIKYHAAEDMTYESLCEEYAPHARFKAFEQEHIYGCNTQYRNYYEETPFHPERLLRDLAAIFHPSLFEGHVPFYYTPLSHE